MNSAIEEIRKLRKEETFSIDTADTNRYRIVVNERDNTKTAYYFSTPVYDIKTQKPVDQKFKNGFDGICLKGTSADIILSEDMRVENEQGFCRLEFPSGFRFIDEKKVLCGESEVYPTVNGVVFKTGYLKEPLRIVIKPPKPYLENTCNGKYFSLMSEKFRPSLTVSCIGVCDDNGFIIAPAKIRYNPVSKTEYELLIYAETASEPARLMFEINSYESKLFQDTTVESRNPDRNNVFGGTAFIGHTEEFGEQWLYSRLMYNVIYDSVNRKINKAFLHFPKLSRKTKDLSVFTVQYRFCSFGSTWNNKKAIKNKIADMSERDGYMNADITEAAVSTMFSEAIWTKGLLIRPKSHEADFLAVSTGDSSYSPVIFEINYV